MKYKFLEHTADVKFQAFGKTLEEAFESSALALAETITKGEKINGRIKKKFEVKGKDNESLLQAFLEEFLYLLDAENFILSKIEKLKISGDILMDKDINKKKFSINSRYKNASGASSNLCLTATVIGDKASSYKFSNDVKAVTYNEMFVKKEKGKFVCQVVLDV